MPADRAALVGRRLLGVAVAHQLDAGELALAADVADQFVALLQRFQPLAHLRADAPRLGRHVLLLDHVQAGDAGGADQRVVGCASGWRRSPLRSPSPRSRPVVVTALIPTPPPRCFAT